MINPITKQILWQIYKRKSKIILQDYLARQMIDTIFQILKILKINLEKTCTLKENKIINRTLISQKKT